MVKRGYNGVYGLGHIWTMNHELGRVKIKVKAKIANASASGTNETKQRGRGNARSRSRGRARSSSKGRGQSCDQGPASQANSDQGPASQAGPSQANSDQGPASQGDSDQGPATIVLRDENGDPDVSLPMETMEPLPPLNQSLRNKLLKQPPLTCYFKPMLSHVTVLPNTDEVPIPTTIRPIKSEPKQSVPKQSVPKKGKNKIGQQKGKGSVRTIEHFFQVQKHPSGARVSGGPAQVEQTGDSSSGSQLNMKLIGLRIWRLLAASQ